MSRPVSWSEVSVPGVPAGLSSLCTIRRSKAPKHSVAPIRWSRDPGLPLNGLESCTVSTSGATRERAGRKSRSANGSVSSTSPNEIVLDNASGARRLPPLAPTWPALAAAVIGDTQRAARSDIVGAFEPGAAGNSIAGLGFSPEAALQILNNRAEVEPTTLSILHVFWATSAILLFAAALIWLSPRTKRSGGMPMGH